MREPEPVTGTQAELPATESDRRRVQDVLERRYVDGHLSVADFDERLGQALLARTDRELDTLLRDLPPIPPPRLFRMAGTEPRGRSRDVRAQAKRYALVMALLVVIWLLTTPGGYFWPVWPMLGWGIGLASAAVGRCGPTVLIPSHPAGGATPEWGTRDGSNRS